VLLALDGWWREAEQTTTTEPGEQMPDAKAAG
jgi:hypothetical protein